MSDLDKLPKRLSPSRASTFKQCPKKFYFTSILGLPSPSSEEAMRGNLAHDALEHMYKLPKMERTEEAALGFLDSVGWVNMREREDYKELKEVDPKIEQRMNTFAKRVLHNYFLIENPTLFDPVGLEEHVSFTTEAGVEIHGYIDRLDEIPINGENKVFISDYKTGRIPSPRYASKAFYAMRIYAWLLYKSTGKVTTALHLVYLQGKTREKAVLRETMTEASILQAGEEIKNTWTKIRTAAALEEWEAKPSKLCDWCPFKKECPAWEE